VGGELGMPPLAVTGAGLGFFLCWLVHQLIRFILAPVKGRVQHGVLRDLEIC
jgi:hypothetical protein